MLLKISVLLSVLASLRSVPITVNGVRDSRALLPLSWNTPLSVQFTLPFQAYSLDIIQEENSSCHKTSQVLHSVGLEQKPQENVYQATILPEVVRAVLEPAALFSPSYYLSLRLTESSNQDYIQRWELALQPPAKSTAADPNCFTFQPTVVNFFGTPLQGNNMFYTLTAQALEYVPLLYISFQAPANSGTSGCGAFSNIALERSWIVTFNDLYQDCRGLCDPPGLQTNTHYYEVNDYLNQRSFNYELDLARIKPISSQMLNMYELPLYVHLFINSDAGPGYLIIPLTIQFQESYILSKYRFTNICKDLSSDSCSFPTTTLKCDTPIDFDQTMQLGRVPDLSMCGLNTLSLLDSNRISFDWTKAAEVTGQAALFNHLQTGFSNSYLLNRQGRRLNLPLMADNSYYWMLNGDFWDFFGYHRIGESINAQLCTTLDNCNSPWCSLVKLPPILKYPEFPSCASINRLVLKQHHQIILYPETISTLQDLEIEIIQVLPCSLQNPRLADAVISPYSDLNQDRIRLDQYDHFSCTETLLECTPMEGLASVLSLYDCVSYDDIHFHFCEMLETEDTQVFKCAKDDQCYLGFPRAQQYAILKQAQYYQECAHKFCLFPSPQSYHVPQVTLQKRCSSIGFLNCASLKTQLETLLKPYPYNFSVKVPSKNELIAKYLREHSSFSGSTITLKNLKHLSQYCSNCVLFLHQFQVEKRDEAQQVFYKLNEVKFELKIPSPKVSLTLEAPTVVHLEDPLDISLFSKSNLVNLNEHISLVQNGGEETVLGKSQVHLSPNEKLKYLLYGAEFDSTIVRAVAQNQNKQVLACEQRPLLLKLNSIPSILSCGSLEINYSLNDGTALVSNSLGYLQLREGSGLQIEGQLNRENCEEEAEILQLFLRSQEDLNQENEKRGLLPPQVTQCGYLPLYCQEQQCSSVNGAKFQSCYENQDQKGRIFTRCDYSDQISRQACVLSWDERALFSSDTGGNSKREERIHPLHSSKCRTGADFSNCPVKRDCLLRLKTDGTLPSDQCQIDGRFTSIQTHPPNLLLELGKEEEKGLSKKLRAIRTQKGKKVHVQSDIWEEGEQEFWVHLIGSVGSAPMYLRQRVSLLKLVGRQESNVAVPSISNYQFGFNIFAPFADQQTQFLISLLGVSAQFMELYQIIMSTPEGKIQPLQPQKDIFEFSWQESVRWFKYDGSQPRGFPLYFNLVYQNSWLLPTAKRDITIIQAPPGIPEVNLACELSLMAVEIISGAATRQNAGMSQNGFFVLSGSRQTEIKYIHDMDKCNPNLVSGWDYEVEIILRRIQVLYLDCIERQTCPGLEFTCQILPMKCSVPVSEMTVDDGATTHTCSDIWGRNYPGFCYAVQDKMKKRTVRCDYTTTQQGMPNRCVIKDLLIPHPLQFDQAGLKPSLSFDVGNYVECFNGNFDICPFKEACFYILQEVLAYPNLQGCGTLRDYNDEYIEAWREFIGPQIHSQQFTFNQIDNNPLSRWIQKATISYPAAKSASIVLPRFSQAIPPDSMIYVHALIYQKAGKDKPVFFTTTGIPINLWQPPARGSQLKRNYYFSGLQMVDALPFGNSVEIQPKTETQDPTFTYAYSSEIRKLSDLTLVESLSFVGGKLTLSPQKIVQAFGISIEETTPENVILIRRRAFDSQNNPRYELDVEIQIEPRMMAPPLSAVNQVCQPSINQVIFSSGTAVTPNAESIFVFGLEELTSHKGEAIEIDFGSQGCTGNLWGVFPRNMDDFKKERAQIMPGELFPSLCPQQLLTCSNQQCQSQFLDKTYTNCQDKTDPEGVDYTICPTRDAPRCIVKNTKEMHPKERSELGACYDPQRTQWADGRCGVPPFCLDSNYDMSTITLIHYTEIIKLLLREHTFSISDLDLSSFHHFEKASLWQGLGAQSTVAEIETQFFQVARLASRDILLALFPDIREVCDHFYYFKNRANIEPLLLKDAELLPPLQIQLEKQSEKLIVSYQEALRLAQKSQIHEINLNFIYAGPSSAPDYAVLPLKLQFTLPDEYTFDLSIEPHPLRLYTSERLRLVARVRDTDLTEPFLNDRFEIMWRCPVNLEQFCSTEFLPIRVTSSHAIYTSILQIPANSATAAIRSQFRVSVSKKDTWASIEERTEIEYEFQTESQCRVQILTPDLTINSKGARIEWLFSHALCQLEDVSFQNRENSSECTWCGSYETCGEGRGYSLLDISLITPGIHQILVKMNFLRGGVSETVNRKLIVRKGKYNSIQAQFEGIIRTVSKNTALSLELMLNSPSTYEYKYEWTECPQELQTRCALHSSRSLEVTSRDSFKETKNLFKVQVSTPSEKDEAQIELIETPSSLAGLILKRQSSPSAVHYYVEGPDNLNLNYKWVAQAIDGVSKVVTEFNFKVMTSQANHLVLHLTQIEEGSLVVVEVVISSQNDNVSMRHQFYTAQYSRGYVELKGSRDIMAGVGKLSVQFHGYQAQEYLIYCGEETMARSFNPLVKEVEVLAQEECGTQVIFPNGKSEKAQLKGVQISKAQVVDIEIMQPDYLLFQRDNLSRTELRRVNERLREQMQYVAEKILCNDPSSLIQPSVLPQFISGLLKHVNVLDVQEDFDNDSQRISHLKPFQDYLRKVIGSIDPNSDSFLETPIFIIFMKLLRERRKLNNPHTATLFSEVQPLLQKALSSMTQKFKGSGAMTLVAHTPSTRSHFFSTFSGSDVHIRQENEECQAAAAKRGSSGTGILVLIQKPSQAQLNNPNLSLLSRTVQTYCLTEDGYIIDLAEKGVTSLSYTNIEDERDLETSSPYECKIWVNGEWRADLIQTTQSADSIVCVTTKGGEITLAQRISPMSGGNSGDSTPLWLILMIVGICVGCVVLLIIIIIVLKKQRRKKLLKHKVMPTETETPRPKESNSNMIPDRKRTEVPETSRELNQNNNSLEDIE